MTNEEFIKSISLEGEEWRDVVGYEGLYMVSSLGRIASMSRFVRTGHSMIYTKQKILKQTKLKKRNTYFTCSISLSQDGIVKKHIVSRVVAKAFIPNPNNYPEIDHIDANPLNNKVENLRFCTHSQNVNNPITRKRNSLAKTGKINTSSSKSVVQLRDAQLIKIYPSMSEAERNGFYHSEISLCCNGLRNIYKGYHWMFLSDYEKITNKSKNDLSVPTDNT